MLRAASLLVLALAACGNRPVVRADPPMVTACLEEPTAHVPDEPQRPAAGAPLTDAYVRDLLGWANGLLGVITADRIAWRGERRCIGRLRDAGQVQ